MFTTIKQILKKKKTVEIGVRAASPLLWGPEQTSCPLWASGCSLPPSLIPSQLWLMITALILRIPAILYFPTSTLWGLKQRWEQLRTQ